MNNPDTFLIVGSGGRESAIARCLMQDTRLCAVMDHANPTLIACVEQTGGAYTLGATNDPQVVLKAAQQYRVDYVFVSADDPLAKGVIDALLAHGIKAIGGTQAATRIEWDKVYAMEMMQQCCPSFTPFYKVVTQSDELAQTVAEFSNQGMEVVVKPQGLTGGKGVKVMPEHLKTYEDAVAYGEQLFRDKPSEKVLLVEKIEGLEFTVMGITDGEHLVMAPATYDYPFRLEGDLGPGTGGMGCFTAPGSKLPFMDDCDVRDCRRILQSIIDEIKSRGLSFNGILNGGFFKTTKGIKFMEFNARFGDPEALNVLATLEGSLSELLRKMWDRQLAPEHARFRPQASVVKYLVAEEYPSSSPRATVFTLNEQAIEAMGVQLFFASCIKEGPNTYKTLKKSRVVALVAVADSIEQAASRIDEAIESHIEGDLDYRRDIGSRKSVQKLTIPVA